MFTKRKSNQVVVVTGASAGVGRATVRQFAKEGASLALIARGLDGLTATKKEVEELGGRAIVFPLDVSDADAIERAAQEIEDTLGPIDVWINNAMVSVFSPIIETLPEEFKRVTEVTYLGYVYGTLSALRRMKARDRGHIIQVGSALAHRSIPLQSAYCAAKHAVMGFTESLWTELLHDNSNVKVSVVQLPAVNTPQFGWVKSRLPNKPQPVPPIFQPEVVADAIVWTSYNPQREVLVGFPTIMAVYGEKFAAPLADHYLAANGFESQQTSEPKDDDRMNNLWSPVPGDHGAHGAFDDRAKKYSIEFLLRKNLKWIFAMGAVLAAGVFIPRRLANEGSP